MAAANPVGTFNRKLNELAEEIRAVRSVNINSAQTKSSVKDVVQFYFRTVNPYLVDLAIDGKTLDLLSVDLQNFNRLASSNNARQSYLSCLKSVRDVWSKLEVAIASNEGKRLREKDAPTVLLSTQDKLILETLDSIIPTAALSYKQAIFDLSQVERASYRGVAAELREVLRELLDHMAPDTEVIKSPGFKLEKDTTAPTQRQKAKFILKSRNVSKTAQGAPLKTIEALEEVISSLARSVYQRGSLSAHIGATKKEAAQLKRYLDVVLCEFLQIS